MSKKLSGKGLVIQLTSGQLRMIKTTLGAPVPKVQASFVADLPAGAVEDGVIRNLDAVREVLQSALSTPDFRRVKKAVFVLCTSQVISEDATLPPVPVNKLDKMLEANMDMYFPVDTQNYHLTWQLVEKETKKGEMLVQMWAVSSSIVRPYYSLANTCGLSVVAIDYCSHALATAVDASFAAPVAAKQTSLLNKPLFGGKKDTAELTAEDELAAVALAEAETAVETELHLMAEPEHLLMLFVQNGQVKMQRMSLCRSSAESELGEVLMALDYFESMNVSRYGTVRCVLSGSLAANEEFVAVTRDMLNIPVEVLPALYDTEWVLCSGAARTTLDFGIPTLNRPGGMSEINNAWQYGLVLVGGLALALSLVAAIGSRNIWTTTLNGLESTKQTLQIQAAQNSDYARNYYDYQTAYRNYSTDWDDLFGSLRTYNDNLSLMFNELEDTLPEDTSVVGIQVADVGLMLELASPTKEEAAYTIMALRELQYADLLDISDLAKPVYELPPLEGSFDSMQYLEALLESGLITEDMINDLIESGAISDEALEDLMVNGVISEQLIRDILASGMVNEETVKNVIESGVVTEDTIKDMVESGVITEDMVSDFIESGVITEDMVNDLIESGAISEDTLSDLIESGIVTDEMINDFIESGAITDEMIEKFLESGVISQEDLQKLVDNGTVTEDMLKDLVESGIITQAQLDKLLGNDKPSSDKPNNDKPNNDKPNSDKPSSDKPSSDKPDNTKPGTTKPGSLSELLASTSKESIIANLFKLTPEEMNLLEDTYAPVPANVDSLDKLLSSAKFEQRQTAMKTMLNEDPIGMYRFVKLMQVDMGRPAGTATLESDIYSDCLKHSSIFLPMMKGDMSKAEEGASILVDATTKSNKRLTSAENLIREDKRLEARYAYYLAVAMGKIEASNKPVVNPSEIVIDILTGKYPEGADQEALEKIFEKLIPGLGDFLSSRNETQKPEPEKPNTKPGKDNPTGTDVPVTPGMSIDELLQHLMNQNNGGGMYPTQPVDDRYHYTVILGYKDALIAAERERKGLDYDAKIPELEVAE